MNILIAADSFKGSLSATQLHQIMQSFLDNHGHHVETIAMSDGGEYFLDAIEPWIDAKIISMKQNLFFGYLIPAYYLLQKKTAYIELDVVCGMSVTKTIDVMHHSTYHLGLIIKDAIEHGAKKIIVGIGGSASNDGGAGMLQALGCIFYDDEGFVIEKQMNGELIGEVSDVDLSPLKTLMKGIEVIVGCDVKNPLLGKYGASKVYARQKGASPIEIEILENNMKHFSDVLTKKLNKDNTFIPGAGAAGGVGYAAYTCLNAKIVSGFSIVKDLSQLEKRIKHADLIMTGEGHFDAQSDFGKAPVEVAKIAKKHHKKTIGIFGGSDHLKHPLFDEIYAFAPNYAQKAEAMKHPKTILNKVLIDIAISLKKE